MLLSRPRARSTLYSQRDVVTAPGHHYDHYIIKVLEEERTLTHPGAADTLSPSITEHKERE